MKSQELAGTLRNVLDEDSHRPHVDGKYHPSTITGCPLKAHLDRMAGSETTLNSWLFQGSAVHYYLEETGLMTEALRRAGYSPVYTSYEVHREYKINDDVTITGTCDILTRDGEDEVILDIKYSSLPVDSGHGRIYKYFSQANTYAHMFGADEYGLIMINSKSRNLLDDIHVLDGEMSEENWEIVKQKAINIHEALNAAGFHDDVRWAVNELEDAGKDFWKEVVAHFDKSQIPSYDQECKYCDHAEYCPVEQGKLGGVNALIDN